MLKAAADILMDLKASGFLYQGIDPLLLSAFCNLHKKISYCTLIK